MSEHRWSKFWWADWRGDPGLRGCSFAARGLWMDLLCLAHDGTPQGHVTINGKPATHRQIAMNVGGDEKTVVALIAELEQAGVFSRGENSEIVSRRMVRDAAKSEIGRENIAKRVDRSPPTSAPISPPSRVPVSPPSTLDTEADTDTESEAEKSTPPTPRKREVACQGDFEDFWNHYPRKIGKGQARKAFAAALKKTTADVLLKAVSGQRWSAEERYQPHASTWLNGERWLDTVDNFDPVLRAAGLKPEDFEDEPEAGYPLARMLQ